MNMVDEKKIEMKRKYLSCVHFKKKKNTPQVNFGRGGGVGSFNQNDVLNVCVYVLAV